MSAQGSILFDAPVQQSCWQVPSELPDLRPVPRFSLDCETNGKNVFKHKPVGVSLGWRDESQALRTIYAPFGHASGNIDPQLVHRWLSYILRDKEVVFANAKFDVHMLRNGFDLDLEALGVKPSDVAFSAALRNDSRHADLSLNAIGLEYVGRGKEEFPGDLNRMATYASWMAGPYAEGDAGITLESD